MLVTVSSGTSGAHSGDGSSLIGLHGIGAVLQSDDPVPGIGLEGEFDWPAAQALHSVSASPSQGRDGDSNRDSNRREERVSHEIPELRFP